MSLNAFHIPGDAKSLEPPAALVELADTLNHPLAKQTGITCTTEGDWALLIAVPRKTQTPLPEIEAQAKGFPVIYIEAPDKPLLPF